MTRYGGIIVQGRGEAEGEIGCAKGWYGRRMAIRYRRSYCLICTHTTSRRRPGTRQSSTNGRLELFNTIRAIDENVGLRRGRWMRLTTCPHSLLPIAHSATALASHRKLRCIRSVPHQQQPPPLHQPLTPPSPSTPDQHRPRLRIPSLRPHSTSTSTYFPLQSWYGRSTVDPTCASGNILLFYQPVAHRKRSTGPKKLTCL